MQTRMDENEMSEELQGHSKGSVSLTKAQAGGQETRKVISLLLFSFAGRIILESDRTHASVVRE